MKTVATTIELEGVDKEWKNASPHIYSGAVGKLVAWMDDAPHISAGEWWYEFNVYCTTIMYVKISFSVRPTQSFNSLNAMSIHLPLGSYANARIYPVVCIDVVISGFICCIVFEYSKWCVGY